MRFHIPLGGLVLAILAATIFVYPASAAKPSTLLFERTWGGFDSEFGEDVAVGSDGSIYVAATTFSFGFAPGDAALLKYSIDGRLLWQRTYSSNVTGFRSDDFAGDLAIGPDGSLYLSGEFSDSVFLVRFSSDGVLGWQREWTFDPANDTSYQFVGGLDTAPDGIYFAGSAGHIGGNDDTFLLKFAYDGTLLWQRLWGAPARPFNQASFEEAHGVAVSPDGASVYVTGDARGFGQNEIYLVKYGSDGTLLWERTWFDRPFGLPTPQGIDTASDGSIYVTGRSSDSGVFLLKFAPLGELVWQRTWTGSGNVALDVAVDDLGNAIVTGNTGSSGNGLSDAFVLRWSSDGRLREARSWGGPDTDGRETGQAVAVSPVDGTLIAVGEVSSPSPYNFGKMMTKTGILNEGLRTPNGTLPEPVSLLTVPDGVVTVPDGSTVFAGGTDAFLIKLRPGG